MGMKSSGVIAEHLVVLGTQYQWGNVPPHRLGGKPPPQPEEGEEKE